MKSDRAAGIIMHPTSLPGPHGIGDFGPDAYRWVNFLAESGCTLWQVLPLGPTGYGDSPYQCFSAFAGNPYLISPTLMLEDDLLEREDFLDCPHFSDDKVDYGEAIQWKLKILDRGFARFKQTASAELVAAFQSFQEQHHAWLDDFALYMTIKDYCQGASWDNWPPGLRQRQSEALSDFCQHQAEILERHQFRQFLFFQQWQSLRKYAHQKGIQIIGDVPIFVAYDSADAWSHPQLFHFDDQGRPTVVAGVPPDYFSPTGQLWGNPLYRWDIHEKTGYAWWIERIRSTLDLYDYIRLDHFRGFAGYWEVPAGMPTAEKGHWVQGPGIKFFQALQHALEKIPLLAEDLGEITPDVIELRDRLKLPGMKILQFAFAEDASNPFLPHNYSDPCIAYTGTHDNDTSLGWFNQASEVEKKHCLDYLNTQPDTIVWSMIRAVWSSVALFALAPIQDFLNLDSHARMNFPGQPTGNWSWRITADALDSALSQRIFKLNTLYGRLSKRAPQSEVGPREVI